MNTTSNTPNKSKHQFEYQQGFGNEFQTEAIPNALPRNQNNPQRCPYNLYAEQLSGSSFTTRRSHNLRTWMYRMQPSVSSYMHDYPWSEYCNDFGGCDWNKDLKIDPNPMRWGPLDWNDVTLKNDKITFVHGLKTYAGTGDPSTKSGLAIYLYAFNANMSTNNSKDEESFYNSDGDFLIVPQCGTLTIRTELGFLVVEPNEFCVIPRGVVFCVDLMDDNDDDNDDNNDDDCADDGDAAAAIGMGYVLEVFGGHFTLPELGPIGANSLASPRDFYYPVASFSPSSDIPYSTNSNSNSNSNLNQLTKQEQNKHIIYNKMDNALFHRPLPPAYTPYNVVAWHGNYAPYKYNLLNFCTINSVSYDHPDPSIYTVLTAQDGGHGGDDQAEALADLIVFPPRWSAAEHTFRPPYFHRNCMSEFMGLIYGQYDGKQQQKEHLGKVNASTMKKSGFQPGGCSLHPCMCPHGPDRGTFEKASAGDVSKPMKLDQGLAFMFETKMLIRVSKYARNCVQREQDYVKCWDGLKNNFVHDGRTD